MTPKEIALAAVEAIFVEFSQSKAKALLHPDYIQHNPHVPTGSAPILAIIPELKKSGIQLTVHRVLAEGDLVVFHNHYENAHLFGAPNLVGFDVFRIQDGLVVEHWDNLQAPGEPNVSGRTLTDGPSDIIDIHLTQSHKNLVSGFAQNVLIDQKFDRMSDYINSESYKQHNPMIGDGLDALKDAFDDLAAQGMSINYQKIHRIIADGNYVFLMAEGKMGSVATAFFDLFRLDEGIIVEHWDIIAPIEISGVHQNGKF